MQVYLSSFRMGDRFDELVEALPKGSKVGVVFNAVDNISAADRDAYVRDVFDPRGIFASHGFCAENLDLRDHFGDPSGLAKAIEDLRLIWTNGGNSFLLRRAMQYSGLDHILRKRVTERSIVYGGFSAGAVVAGPSLRGIEHMDDPNDVPQGYEAEPVWEGLGLVDFCIVPHFQSDHPEADAATRTVDWFKTSGLAFRALRDGEAIVI